MNGSKVEEIIQVCWDINNKETLKREQKSILEALKNFKVKKGVIITKNTDKEEKIGQNKIVYISLRKWLLML